MKIELSVRDPVLHYLLPITPDSATLRQWTRSHDYDVWTDCRPEAEPPLTLWEGRGRQVLRIPDSDHVMHIVAGGTPHHVEGLFGYWRTCDSDLIWVRARRDGYVRYAMVIGGCPSAYRSDALSWICPQCGEALGMQTMQTGRSGVDRFWKKENEWVSDFNRSEDARTCRACGHLHPPAYVFGAGTDLAW